MSDDKTITAEQYAELKAQLDKVNSDLEYQRSEAKKAFEKRDEYKKQIEEAETKKAQEQNQFKELYEKEQETKKALESEVNTYKPYKEKWETYETTRRGSLLEKVEDADLKKAYEKLELSDLELVVAKITSKTPPTDQGRSGKTNFDYNGKKWDEISSADKETLAKDQPDIYRKLYYEKFRRQPNL